MSRWTHATEADHEADPRYQITGQPSYWVCHACREPILLDGAKPPVTVPVSKAGASPEPDMSAQP